MQQKFQQNAEQYTKQNRGRRVWRRIVRVMAGCVVFCTTYALILPAITMEQETFCGYEEHTHTESCYIQPTRPTELICSLEALNVHAHTEACLDEAGNPICGKADYIAHTHDADCYDMTGSLVCDIPEAKVHEHTDACYGSVEIPTGSHTHTDTCYNKEKGELTCTAVEQEAHTHTDACKAAQKSLVCTTAESAGHTHSDSCYTTVNALTCTTAESAGHAHGAACYDAEGALTCTTAESAGHTHGDGCYTAQKKLTCGQAEQEAHTHGDSCYETPVICGLIETTGHAHTDACYAWKETVICGLEETPIPEPELICTTPIADEHTHGDGCFVTAEELPLTCKLEESEEHTHDFLCYGNWELICPTEEHEHELACFADPEADLETEAVWKNSLPDKLTGVYIDDLLAAAESQLHYTESEKNYIVLEDGETMKGYTRYGDWYGDPYGDWDAMFASFCLYYAGANKLEALKDFPLESDPAEWVKKLEAAETEEIELFLKAEDGTPEPGDLVFFDNDEDEANTPDHVGIVIEIVEEKTTKLRIYEGDTENQVQKNKYELDDPAILGYGLLPEVPDYDPYAEEAEATEAAALPGNVYTYSDDTLYVEVELPEDTEVPADAVLTVTPIASDDDSYEGYVAQAEEAVDGTVANIALYDISFYTADGTYIPVSDTANVTMGFTESPVDAEAEIQILHFEEAEAAPQIIEDVTLEEKELEMILADVQQAQESTAEVEAEQAQIAPVSGEAAESAPAEIAQSEAPAASAFSRSRSAEEAEEETEALTETEAAQQTDPTEETESAAETAPVVETVTEVRTVIEFTTDGFSTFAVVEVSNSVGAVTNILSHDQMGDLAGLTLMISTYNATDGKQYALTSDKNGNYLKAVPVTRDDTTVRASELNDNMLWTFETNADGGYNIQSVATKKYLNFSKDNDNVGLGNAQKINVLTTGVYNNNNNASISGSQMICLSQNGKTDDGRELSLNVTTREFAAYNNNDYNALVLSIPAVETTVLTKDQAKAGNLAGRVFAISASEEMNYAYPGITYDKVDYNNAHGLKAINITRDGTIAYVGQDMLWKFEQAVGGYYIRVYDTVQETAGQYLQMNDGNYVTLVSDPDNNCIFTVADPQGTGNYAISLQRGDRYLSYEMETGIDAFTGFRTRNQNVNDTTYHRGDLVLSEYGTIADNVVTNLDGQKLAIISVRNTTTDMLQLVTQTIQTSNRNVTGPKGEVLNGAALTIGTDTISTISGVEIAADNYWTFEAAGVTGQYYIKSSSGQYIQITDKGDFAYVTLAGVDQRTAIQVTSKTVNDQTVVLLSVPGTNIYLNRYGGPDDETYACWDNADAVKDPGSYFVLVREVVLKATVVSRSYLREAAMMPGAQLVIFARQIDANGVARYYAVNADGSATEIYLEGDTLAEGSVIYSSTDSENMRWDATSTPNATDNGGWNTSNNVNGAIDLMAKNIGAALFLSPNMDGGYGGANGDGTDGAQYRGKASITSMIENTVDGARWYNSDNRNGMPVRANHNASFRRITGNNNLGLDLNIASTIVSDLSYKDDDTTRTSESCQIFYENGGFVAKDSDGYTQADNADDSIAFYVALIDQSEKFQEVESDADNLVAQILTREEFQATATQYGEDYPFIIFAQDANGNLYALDAEGKAQPISLIEGAELVAGDRIIFQTEDGGEDYNPNRILWNPSFDDGEQENAWQNGWVDLSLYNEATHEFLSPHMENDEPVLTNPLLPIPGDHTPGFFYINDEDNFHKAADIASYLGVLTSNNLHYRLKLDTVNKKFNVIEGWNSENNAAIGDLNGFNGTTEYVFYVAMLVDWDVTVNDDMSIREYQPFTGVNENVSMYVFNYGAAIDLYGQVYNGTDITNEVRAGVGKGLLDYGYDLIYRFFYRPAFGGEAIDGTNDPNGGNTNTTGINGNKELYSNASDPTDVGSQRVFAKTLINGYPALEMPITFNSGAGTVTTNYTVGDNQYFSLGYLFDPVGFKSNTVSTDNGNGAYSSLVISDSSVNGDLHAINGNNGTEINKTGMDENGENGKTAPAGEGDSVANNPNYAVRSYPVGNGSTTGLFQRDANGYYYYDSKSNAATYNVRKGIFELYDYSIIPGGYNNLAGGNFLPFNNGYQGRRVADQGKVKSGGNPILNTISKNDRMYQINGFQQNDNTTTGRESMADLWMGMYMEIEFTMTEDGKVSVTQNRRTDDGPKNLIKYTDNNGVEYWYDETKKIVYNEAGNKADIDINNLTEVRNDLVFNFAGDDDVLVYIDDVLVMNINGIHGVWTGKINFRTGLVENDQYAGADTNGKYIGALLRAATNTEEVVSYAEDGLGDTLAPNTGHTLKFYYLERGGNISDCAISFNLEAIPTGDLSISKEVVGVDNGEAYSGEYNFKLDIEHLGDIVKVEGKAYPITYEIRDEAGNIVQVKNADGELSDSYEIFENASDNTKEDITNTLESLTITLQANQTAYITGLPENTTLKVIEQAASAGQPIQSVVFTNQKGQTITGTSDASGTWTTDTIEIDSKDTQSGKITCTNTLQPTSVNVTKTVETRSGDTDTTTKFEFSYTIYGADGKAVEGGTGTFTLTNGNTYVINGVPFGGYVTVEETEASAAGYSTTYRIRTRYEAESGTNNTGEIRYNNPETHSGGAYVGGWDNGGSATYTFNSPLAGNATMEIYGCYWGDNRDLVVTINGKTLNVDTVSNGYWDSTNGHILATVTIPVIAGENTMVVGGPAAANAPNVDYFEIIGPEQAGRIATQTGITNPISIYFTNEEGYELPMTGGTGTYLYTIGGLMLTIAAAILLYYHSKRGKEELASS